MSSAAPAGITPATGALVWKQAITPGGDPNSCAAYGADSQPLVSGGVVYAGSFGGTMAFDAATGNVAWTANVGYNANPHECVEIIQKLECPVVKGNHDEQAAISDSLDGFNPLAEEALNWTRPMLSAPGSPMSSAHCCSLRQAFSGSLPASAFSKSFE